MIGYMQSLRKRVYYVKGRCMFFDGTNFISTSAFGLPQTFVISMWVRQLAAPGGSTCLFMYGDVSAGVALYTRTGAYPTDTLVIAYGIGTSTPAQINTGYSLTKPDLSHIALVYDYSIDKFRFFVNFSEIPIPAHNLSNWVRNFNSASIASNKGATNFKGHVFDFRINSTANIPQQHLFAADIVHLNLDEQSGNIAVDSSPFARNAILSNPKTSTFYYGTDVPSFNW